MLFHDPGGAPTRHRDDITVDLVEVLKRTFESVKRYIFFHFLITQIVIPRNEYKMIN